MHHILRTPVNTALRKSIVYKIPCRLWEVAGADIFMINGEILLCIVDYHSKFPIVKKVNSLSADDLVRMTNLILAESGLPEKNVSDADTNFTAEVSFPLQEDEHTANHNIIIPQPKQKPGGSLYIICKASY